MHSAGLAEFLLYYSARYGNQIFSSLWESTCLVFLTILVGQINMNFTMLKIMLIVSVIYMLVISVMYKLVTITPTSTLPLVN